MNWSWATVNLNNTSPVYGGTSHSIAVTYGPWTGLYLAHNGSSSAGRTALEFYINGGTSHGQKIDANLQFSNGSSGPRVNIGTYCTGGSIPTNSWVKCSIPLSALNGVNQTIKGVTFQEWAGINLPKLYFDLISIK
jgi:chitinase